MKFEKKKTINELTHLMKRCKWLNMKSWWLKNHYMIKWKNYFFQILHTFFFSKLHWFRPTNLKKKNLYEICIKISFKSKPPIKTFVKSMKNMNCRWLNTIRCKFFFKFFFICQRDANEQSTKNYCMNLTFSIESLSTRDD